MAARTVALTCNNCGASLTLSEDVRFVTCSHCGARLEIERTTDTIYTKVLEKVTQVERVANDAAAEIVAVKFERELEKIDAKLASLKHPGGHGVTWMCGVLAMLGLLLAVAADEPQHQAAGVLNVLMFGSIALLLGVLVPRRLRTYEAETGTLKKQREDCVARMRAAGLPAPESSARRQEADTHSAT